MIDYTVVGVDARGHKHVIRCRSSRPVRENKALVDLVVDLALAQRPDWTRQQWIEEAHRVVAFGREQLRFGAYFDGIHDMLSLILKAKGWAPYSLEELLLT